MMETVEKHPLETVRKNRPNERAREGKLMLALVFVLVIGVFGYIGWQFYLSSESTASLIEQVRPGG